MPFADSGAPPPSWAEVRPTASWPVGSGAVASASDASGSDASGPVESGSGASGPVASRPSESRSGRRKSGSGAALRPPPDPETEGVEPDAHDIARQIVLRQLTNSPKSRSQLEQALARKGCDPDVAASVLDRMEEVGLVDDGAYAGMLVRSQRAGRGLARRALAQTLRQKGVTDEVAESVLDEVDPAEEEERARELVAKRMRRLHGLDAVVQTRRLAGMLARKGYPSEVSMRIIRDAIASADEHRRD